MFPALDLRDFASIKRFQQIIGQGRVEVVGNPYFFARETQRPHTFLILYGHQSRYRDARPRNRDLLSFGNPLKETREMSLCLMDVHFHSE
jgi:hypothetical protein